MDAIKRCGHVCVLEPKKPTSLVWCIKKGRLLLTQPHSSVPFLSTATLPRLQKYRINRCRNIKSKMLDKIKSLSTKVKNQHEECQCLRREREGGERHLKIYIYSESVQDQTAKLICSSFNPCSTPSSQFLFSPSIDFLCRPSP